MTVTILATSIFKDSANYGKLKLKEFRKDIKNIWTLLWCKNLQTSRKAARLWLGPC